MITNKMSFGRVSYLVVLGMAIPLAALHVGLGLYHLALIVAAAVIAGVAIEVTGWNPLQAAASTPVPELELMDTFLLPSAPITIRAVAARGICPLGFQPGDTWSLDGEGHLSPWLCRPAVDSLSAILQAPQHNGNGKSISCRCPLRDRELAFAVAKAA